MGAGLMGGGTMRTTQRLVLRPFRDEDLEPWIALNTDPEVMMYLGGEPLSREESIRIAEGVNKRYAADGTGFLAIERRTDGAFMGACGLQHTPWFPDFEIGWRLAREYWGHGYATEAAASWLEHGFTAMELPHIISVTDTPNARSIAVMRRLGMTFDHEAVLEEDGVEFDATIYRLTAEAW